MGAGLVVVVVVVVRRRRLLLLLLLLLLLRLAADLLRARGGLLGGRGARPELGQELREGAPLLDARVREPRGDRLRRRDRRARRPLRAAAAADAAPPEEAEALDAAAGCGGGAAPSSVGRRRWPGGGESVRSRRVTLGGGERVRSRGDGGWWKAAAREVRAVSAPEGETSGCGCRRVPAARPGVWAPLATWPATAAAAEDAASEERCTDSGGSDGIARMPGRDLSPPP